MRRWHNPGDLPVDRARQVALEYRRALLLVDPDACRVIDAAAGLAGEGWVTPDIAVETEDDLVTVSRAADLTGYSVATIYKWIAQDKDNRIKATKPSTMVRLGDIYAARAYERGRRAQRDGQR